MGVNPLWIFSGSRVYPIREEAKSIIALGPQEQRLPPMIFGIAVLEVWKVKSTNTIRWLNWTGTLGYSIDRCRALCHCRYIYIAWMNSGRHQGKMDPTSFTLCVNINLYERSEQRINNEFMDFGGKQEQIVAAPPNSNKECWALNGNKGLSKTIRSVLYRLSLVY